MDHAHLAAEDGVLIVTAAAKAGKRCDRLPPMAATDGRPRRVFVNPPILEFINATVLRGGMRALDGLSLRIDPGEHTAILGPNGAGKTSLLRLITCDDRPLAPPGPPDAALVPPLRLFGEDRWDVSDLRARLGIVTGDLDAGFGRGTSRGRVSGLDAAVSGLFGTQGLFAHQAVTAAMRARGAEALARVDASHLASKPLTHMSTGERRRVLIARALVTRPEALLLDEPTTGLDFVARHAFMESVRRLARAGTTVILVTHHAEELIPEIDRVVLLAGGRVAFDGGKADALTGARLSAVFGGPIAVARHGEYFTLRVESGG